jgi:hypothetical protein
LDGIRRDTGVVNPGRVGRIPEEIAPMVNALIMIYGIIVITGIVILLDWLGRRKDRHSKQPKLPL